MDSEPTPDRIAGSRSESHARHLSIFAGTDHIADNSSDAWIAGATGAALVGIDFSDVALEQARARARRIGITCSYQSGSFDATGLDSASVDGAFSIDVIWAIPDKPAGFAETARILKRGASRLH